ncbi:glutathione s-transferase [Colletotrichum asianum]
MSTTKPIVLYGHIVMILRELEIPYEMIKVEFTDVKKKPFTTVNPNGRLPAIVDPNTGITLWESGAIIEYLVETYDTESRLSYTSFPEKFHLKQFLAFQMSGQVTSCPLLTHNDNSDGRQGPYFGQLGWFKMFHPEDVPSAKERYEEQTVRVLSVLDRVLKGREYLVGDKATYVDIAFMPWDYMARRMLDGAWNDKFAIDKEYPDYAAWAERIRSRPAVEKTLAAMKSERAKEESSD